LTVGNSHNGVATTSARHYTLQNRCFTMWYLLIYMSRDLGQETMWCIATSHVVYCYPSKVLWVSWQFL